MKRLDFLKTSGLAVTGLTLGVITPFKLMAKVGSPKVVQKVFNQPYYFEYADRNSPQWMLWLAELVVGALVTALVAKVVDRMIPDPVCTGNSCAKKNASYLNANGIYGYQEGKPRFYKQDIQDASVNFQNVSVPFVRYNQSNCGSPYQEITRLEGPYLAGLCFLTNSFIEDGCTPQEARKLMVPKKEIINAGYRFDTGDCSGNRSTAFETDEGKVTIKVIEDYYPRQKNVNVVYDSNGNISSKYSSYSVTHPIP